MTHLREIHDYINCHIWHEFKYSTNGITFVHYRYCACGKIQYHSGTTWNDSKYMLHEHKLDCDIFVALCDDAKANGIKL